MQLRKFNDAGENPLCEWHRVPGGEKGMRESFRCSLNISHMSAMLSTAYVFRSSMSSTVDGKGWDRMKFSRSERVSSLPV